MNADAGFPSCKDPAMWEKCLNCDGQGVKSRPGSDFREACAVCRGRKKVPKKIQSSSS